MTGTDPMPFGAHKGTPLKDVPKSYWVWCQKQDWFTEKWKDLNAWITGGDIASSTPKEREVLATEEILLNSVSTPFRRWWFQAYGDRLRKDGEVHYVAYLRVAIGAWEAASKQLAESCTVIPANQPTPPAPPKHQPAPVTPKPSSTPNYDEDEDIPF